MKKETLGKLSKAIVDRWGHEVAEDYRARWNRTKEELYIEQLKAIDKARNKQEQDDKVLVDGVLLPKKLFTKDRENNNRICNMCKTYSLRYADDLYMNKYKVCEKCYIEHLEDRINR